MPPALQRAAFNAYRHYVLFRDRIDLGRRRPFRTYSGRHVVVAGYFGSKTGLARAAELVALTLEQRGVKVTRVDIFKGGKNPVAGALSPARCSPDVSDVVFVSNPGQLALSNFDRDWLLDRTLIGHWIWELEAAPKYWEKASSSFDEIWGATDLLVDVIKRRLPGFDRPIRVLPYAIHQSPQIAVSKDRREAVRRREGFSDQTFVAGYSFAIGSNYLRKNPEGAIEAFRRAFPSEDALLLLRSVDLDQWLGYRRRLFAAANNDPRIRIYGGTAKIGINDFYAALDAYVSPSRAEGYGLNLVEASQSGLPVITGGWRIPDEILSLPGVIDIGFELEPLPHDPQGHYLNLEDAVWSVPDVDEMAESLRRLYRRHQGL